MGVATALEVTVAYASGPRAGKSDLPTSSILGDFGTFRKLPPLGTAVPQLKTSLLDQGSGGMTLHNLLGGDATLGGRWGAGEASVGFLGRETTVMSTSINLLNLQCQVYITALSLTLGTILKYLIRVPLLGSMVAGEVQ